MKDRHVEAVIEKMRSRSEVGYKKYGTNLERTDYTFLDWVVAAQEEMLDGALYLQVLRDRFENDLKNTQNIQD